MRKEIKTWDHLTMTKMVVSGSRSNWEARGFVDQSEVNQYCTEVEQINYGYSPTTQIREENGKFIVYCSVWNSCD